VGFNTTVRQMTEMSQRKKTRWADGFLKGAAFLCQKNVTLETFQLQKINPTECVVFVTDGNCAESALFART